MKRPIKLYLAIQFTCMLLTAFWAVIYISKGFLTPVFLGWCFGACTFFFLAAVLEACQSDKLRKKIEKAMAEEVKKHEDYEFRM